MSPDVARRPAAGWRGRLRRERSPAMFSNAHRSEEEPMISRIWHGWATAANADAYEALLRSEIFTGILGREIAGFRRIQLLRRPLGPDVEFVTEMWFDSIDAVREFAGEDYEVAVVPVKARALLKRFDERSTHYEVREARGA
jgi:hypothetical protein